MKNMYPERMGPTTKALYSVLSDGRPHHIDQVLDVINSAVPLEDAVQYKSGKCANGSFQKRTAQGIKEKTRITLLVARRQGHITIDGDQVTMVAESRERWLESVKE